jgi:hypothetical protein
LLSLEPLAFAASFIISIPPTIKRLFLPMEERPDESPG